MPRATKAKKVVGKEKSKPTAILSGADQLIAITNTIVERIYADKDLLAQMKRDLGLHD